MPRTRRGSGVATPESKPRGRPRKETTSTPPRRSQQSIKIEETEDDGDSVRRSGRKRVISSRLQDMEVSLKSTRSPKRANPQPLSAPEAMSSPKKLRIKLEDSPRVKKAVRVDTTPTKGPALHEEEDTSIKGPPRQTGASPKREAFPSEPTVTRIVEKSSPRPPNHRIDEKPPAVLPVPQNDEKPPAVPLSPRIDEKPPSVHPVCLVDDLPAEPSTSQTNFSVLMECDEPEPEETPPTVTSTEGHPSEADDTVNKASDVVSCIRVEDIIQGNLSVPTVENTLVESVRGEDGAEEAMTQDLDAGDDDIEPGEISFKTQKTATEAKPELSASPTLAEYLKGTAPRQQMKLPIPQTPQSVQPAQTVNITKQEAEVSVRAIVKTSPTVTSSAPEEESPKIPVSVTSSAPEEDSPKIPDSVVILADGRRYRVKVKQRSAVPASPAAPPRSVTSDITLNVETPITVPSTLTAPARVKKEEGEVEKGEREEGEIDLSMTGSEGKDLEEGEVTYSQDEEPSTSILFVDSSGNITNIQPLSALSQDECMEVQKLINSNQEELGEVTDGRRHFTNVRSTVKQMSSTVRNSGDDTVEILPDGKVKCKLCPYVTDKKANWYKHKKKHLGLKNYECTVCDYKCSTSSNLTRHMQIHTGVKQYECDVCGLKFRQKIHAIRHKEFKHMAKGEKCTLCDYRCNKNPQAMTLHMKKKHSQDVSYKCPKCPHIANSRRDLQQHLKFHQTGPELKLFCERCSFVTDCQSRLKRHSLIHSQDRPFKCGICDYSGNQKEHVLRHMRARHKAELGLPEEPERPERPRKPRKSQEASGTESLDTSTQDDSSGQGMEDGIQPNNTIIINEQGGVVTPVPIELPTAGKQMYVDVVYPEFRGRKRYPASDYRSKDKFFACNYCTMKFTKLINLYKHVHQQHNYAPPSDDFCCVICDYKTTSRKNLLVHMRKHNPQDFNEPGGIPAEQADPSLSLVNPLYKCMSCDYTGTKESVHAHMQQKKMVVRETGDVELIMSCVPLTEGETLVESKTVSTEEVVLEQFGEDTKTVLLQMDPGAAPVPIQVAVATGEEEAHVAMVTEDGQVTMVTEGEEAAQQLEGAVCVEEEEEEEQEVPVVEEVNAGKDSSVQIAAEQLMELSSGDLLEINGETYTVEFSNSGQPVVRA